MQSNDYIDALARQGEQLLAAARPNLDAAVPTCPGWQVRDVLGHLGRVYRSVSGILDERAVVPLTVKVPKPPEGAAVADFYVDGLAGLTAALRNIDIDTPVFTWGNNKVAGFYHRRMAHETAAHGFDVLLATGADPTYDGDMAADGISELYHEVMPFGLLQHPTDLPAGSLHLHRTDGDGEWILEPEGASYSLEFGHGHLGHETATASVRGPAAELFRFAWNRGRTEAVEVIGDVEVADAWARLAP